MNPQYPPYQQQWDPQASSGYITQQPYYGQTPSYPSPQPQPPYYPQQQPPPSYPQSQPFYPSQQGPCYSQPQQQYYPPPQPQPQPAYAQPQPQPQYYNQPPAYPQYPYYVFNPAMFSDTNNPWTANMWLQSYNIPTVQAPVVSTQPPPDYVKFTSIEQFQELRHHATVESALKQLNELATDLSPIDPHNFYPEPACCFICCNSYTKPQYKLGVGPINDAITVAANHKFMGYKVYYLHNPDHTLFLKFLKVFLQKVTMYLTVYYTGHGAQMKDTSGDEADGYDEVVVFDSGIIVDDKLAEYLKKYHNPSAHTILLSDCCHSGTIWDIPENLNQAAAEFPPNILSVSASKDNQTAKQSNIERNSQGIFTFNFFTLIRNNPSIRIGDVQRMIEPQLRKFNQQLEMYPTSMDMLSKPVFPLMIKN